MKRLFIVGVPRSGTTWTMLLLAQHPAVTACQQAGFFHSLKKLEDWWRKGGEYGKHVLAVAEGSEGHGAPGAYSRTALKDLLSLDEFYELSRPLAENVFDRVAGSRRGTKVVVEQTPENVELTELILKLFPDAYFLHVVRDPRSVFCSLRSAASAWSNGFPRSPIDVAKIWCSFIDRAQELGRLGDRYHEVRYEALLQDGPRELRRVFDWLGLPADPSLCAKAVESCTLGQLRKSALAPPSFFRKGEAEGWRREASRSDIRCIEYIAGTHMDRLGYQRLNVRPGRPLRLRMRELAGRGLKKTLRGPLRPLFDGMRRRIGRLTHE